MLSNKPTAHSCRWRKSDDTWSCALHGRILSFRQDAGHLHYTASYPGNSQTPPTPPSSAPVSLPDEINDTEALVKHYMNLVPNLTELYEHWSGADANFKKRAPQFTGVRILKQDAWEALVGFICSSNNNIVRISQMVFREVTSLCLGTVLIKRVSRWRIFAFIMEL